MIEKVFKLEEVLAEAVDSTENILKKILTEAEKKNSNELKFRILDSFDQINSK